MGLTTPMKVVLTIVLIALIGVGFYLLDYQKKNTTLKNLETSLQDKQEQLKTDEKRVQELPEQLKKRERLQAQLDSLIQKQLPRESSAEFVPAFIKQIELLIAEEKSNLGDDTLKIVSISPGSFQVPGTQPEGEGGPKIEALQKFPKQLFNLQITGKYNTVMHFLHQLAALKLKRLVTINRINLNPGGPVEYGKSPLLNISIPVTAYLNEEKQ